MILEDIDVAIDIWRIGIFSLKGNTTRKKTIPVTKDIIQIRKELIKIHKDIVMTAEILFVNTIPFFLKVSKNICFDMLHHLANRKVKTIYTAFNEVYINCRNCRFRIITLQIDGDFSPLQEIIIEYMTGGPIKNITSANEHVPEIERRIRVGK